MRQLFNEGGIEAAAAFAICTRAGMPYDLALSFAQRAKEFLVAGRDDE
jgi:hypothetical protein